MLQNKPLRQATANVPISDLKIAPIAPGEAKASTVVAVEETKFVITPGESVYLRRA